MVGNTSSDSGTSGGMVPVAINDTKKSSPLRMVTIVAAVVAVVVDVFRILDWWSTLLLLLLLLLLLVFRANGDVDVMSTSSVDIARAMNNAVVVVVVADP